MKLVWSAKFTRRARKLLRKPKLIDDLEAALKLLERDPYHAALRTHKLSGDLEGCLACLAGYDLRIIFEFARPNASAEIEIHLLNLGTHNEVY